MPESPWTRAYEENDRQQSLEQRAEEQQINAEGAGIMGAIGMFAAVSLSPAAARKGAKKALRTLGKSSAAGKSFKRVASRARKYADEAGESVGSTAKIADDASGSAGREVARGVDEAHWKKALSKEDFGSRATAAAAYEAKRGGRGYDLTRATKMMGMKGPAKTRDRAKAFREFRQSDAAKEKGTMMALMESTDQRRLLASAASSMKYESAAALPASYAIDSQMGLTGAPEDRAAYNIPGHAKDFMNYLPKYAAYEAGGIGAMGAAGGLFKAGARALKQGLQGNQGAARAVSQTFQGIDAAATRIRKESQAMDARFNRVKNAPSSKWMSKGYEQGREYMMGRYQGAKDAVSRYMGRRASKAKGTGGTSKGAAKLNESAEGRAQDLFQTKKGKNTVAAMISQEAGKDGTEQFTRRLSDDLFVSGEDRTHSEGLARAFGGEAVNVSEVRKAGFDLRASEQKKLNKIQQGIDDTRHRVQQEAGNTIKPGTREALGQMSAENLRMSGYARVGDEVMRMPTGDEIAAKAAKGINDLTHVNNPFGKGGVSLGRVMGLGAIEDQRAAAQTIEGGLPTATRDEAGNVVDRLHYFEGGKAGQAGTPAGIKDPTDDSVNLHRRGVTVKSNGLREESVFAQSKDGGIQHVGDFFMSSRGNTKAYRVRARQHLPDERYTRSSEKKLSQKSSDPTSTIGRMYDRAKQSLRIGSEYGGGADVMRRTKDYLSDSSPGRLFSKDSDLWNINLSKISEPREAEPLADAVYHSRQAMVRGTDVYTQPQVFDKALRNAGLPEEQLNKLGGAEEILTDSQKAFEAAKGVMKRTEEMATDSARRNLRAPSTPEAKKIIDHVGNDPDALYNASGRSRAQTLRRFVFEQGALGHRAQSSKISELSDDIGRMADKGEIREDLAVEAQVGMESLRMQKSAEGLSNPYRSISEQSTFEVQHDSGLRRAKGIIDEKQDLYEKFGKSRPRLDTSYHRDAHTAPDTFNKPYKETGYFAADYSSRVAGSTFLEAGVDTTRRALSEVGLGWSPETSLTTTSGMKELGKTWARRAGAAVGATFAYRMMDAGTDIALPDDAPLGEGITQELSDIAANSRMAASYIYDQFGITDAAQYMEGLMPKSTSILPGAAAGAYAGGILGAVAGATLNRATQPLLTNTPLESLSILPPLAPFVSDMSESYETTKAKYEGREWVPQRKGRFYLLSSSNYEGERIEQYRPNWYVQESSDYEATSVQYGSEMEEAIYKDLPLIDFAPGDLVDPDYLTEKHAADRPYREQGMPFSEVPLIGPAMGATVGKAYMWMHPGGDMGTPSSVQMDGTVGPTDSQGRPMAGGGNVIHRGSMMQREGTMGPASFSQSHTITSGNAPDQVLDEQFYRLTEAMGFTGFATQSAAGGEGIFQRARMPTSGSIDSTARSYHDAQMGDMLGVGEAMRRLYPYERGGEKAMGPKNTMPNWLEGTGLTRGDPYCLAPETLMEANGTLRPAEEVHERLQEGETVHARTHEGRMKEIEASRARPVDEEIVEIEVEGLPWTLAVTEEHPVYVYRNESYQWVLAGEIEEGMAVLEPAGPEGEGLIVGEHETGGAASNKTYDHAAETTAAVQRLRQTEAPDGNYLSKKGLTYRAEWRIDHALQLEGTSGDRRHSRALARLRRELAEHGLPRSLPGASLGALRPLIQRWGEVRKEEAEVRVQITPDRVRPALEEWNMSRPYRPQTTAEEACRSAAYTLQKALAARGAPASIEQEPRGLSVVLRTRNAAEVLFTKYQIERRHAATRRYSGRKPKVLPRPAEPKHVKRAVTSVERRDYDGPVYAFQVEDDSSFVAAGIATHNSQVKKGEAVLPGEGLESTGRLVGSDPMLEAEDIGRSGYGSAMRMLGLRGDEASRREKWAKERVKQRMLDSGAAIRTEAVYTDNQNDFAAVADAATQGNQPIHIQAVSQAEFRSMENPRELDTQQLNATLGAAGRSKGMVAYVDEQSGDVRTFVQNFDSGLYNKSLQKLQRGRQMAKNYAEQGYGSPGAMYSSVDRLQVLQNADPFGDEWQVEHKKAKKQYYSGNMSPRERSAFERLNKQHDEMRKPFEMHPKRFTPDQLMDPAEKHQNLSYNDNVKAAAEYSLPERVIGSIYESACFGPETAIETKTQNKRIVDIEPGDRVLSRDGSWNEVQEVHERRVRPEEATIRLKAAGHSRPVYVTPNHEVMAAREKMCTCPKGSEERYPKRASSCDTCRDRFEPEMIEVGELREGDYLAVRRPEFREIDEFEFRPEFFVDAPLNEGKDGWMYASRQPAKCKYGVPKAIEDDDDLEKWYELMGWYLAEGSIHTDRQVIFTLHIEETDAAEWIENTLLQLFDTGVSHVEKGDKNARDVRVCSKTLARFFSRFAKGQDKYFPQEYIPNDETLIRAFLRGYLRGDGYFHHDEDDDTNRVQVGTASSGTANAIRHMFMRLGYAPSVGKYDVDARRADGTKRFRFSVVLYGHDAADMWRTCLREEPPFEIKVGKQGTFFSAGDFVLYRITNCKAGNQVEKVYDLTVEDDPSYTTSIVTAHNSSMRSPLHTKFFGNPSPKEQYERRVMLERGYQSWEKPVEDFIKPYAMGLAAADDPMQGAASYALGGAVFGNPAIGAVSGVIGSAYGAARGAYESMGGSDYVPDKTQDMRKQSRKLDRFEYYRSKRLYDATGANKYKEKMMETATGWTQAGMEGTGWAKNRRRSYSPSSRLESELYSQDEGFSSPYQGLKKVDDIADAVKTHDSSVLSLTKQSEGKVAKMSGTAGKQMARGVSKGTTAGARTGAPRRLSREASEGSSRSGALAKAQQAANSYHRQGLSPTGMAKRQRGRNTQIQSGRGFASPYRGEDPEKSVQYRARDPVNQPLPPELMTAFKAAPEREKDFVRPFLLAQDPGRQGEIMEMVSPQMGAMLEVGWNYTQGRPTGQATERIRPEGGRRADLMAHPAMGPGADVEGTKIKTLEDSGLSAKEAGLGWQGAMERMEGAIVEPAAIDSMADATRREGGTSMNELRQALNTALLQMGVDAQISIQPSAGPTEVHIREQVG